MRKALILGASVREQEQKNIGSTISHQLEVEGWNTQPHDCYNGWSNQYSVPTRVDWDVDALVVTLGRTAMAPIDEMEPAVLEDVIRGCLTLPLLCVQRYVQERSPNRGGNIVLIGSYAHNHPFSNGVAYCAAKAGLNMAGRTLGWDLTKRGYNTWVVHPYHVAGTPMWEQVQEGVMETKQMSREEADEYAKKDLQMPTLSSADDIARAVAMLLSQRVSSWMSGSNIELYGGTR